MSEFTDEYVNLLIKQYWDRPNARGEIEAGAASWEAIRDVFAQFPDQFDLDSELTEAELGLSGGFVLGLSDGVSVLGLAAQSAIGNRLDLIGKIVGLSRRQPDALNDEDYRLLLKVKIAKNNASAFMVNDDWITIQDVIELAFDGQAFVVDNQDMSLTLYVESAGFDPDLISIVVSSDLLPKPQGVRYDIVANTGGIPFGFAELGEPEPAGVLGFGELGASPYVGGAFVELYGS